MKKLLVMLLLLSAGIAGADPITLNKSSYTTTSDTAYIAARNLDAVVVSSAGVAAGNLKIYNSTYTTSGLIANISLGTLWEYDFKNLQVKGIYYVITSNSAAGVTILYK